MFLVNQNVLVKVGPRTPTFLQLAGMDVKRLIVVKDDNIVKGASRLLFLWKTQLNTNCEGIATPLKVLFNLYGENRWQ